MSKVIYEKDGRIGRITLNRPEVMNAIDDATQFIEGHVHARSFVRRGAATMCDQCSPHF